MPGPFPRSILLFAALFSCSYASEFAETPRGISNPGYSGGLLLNSRGEVIGWNSQKLIKKNINGSGFALSTSDLLAVLYCFYPSIAPARSTTITDLSGAGSVAPEASPTTANASFPVMATSSGSSEAAAISWVPEAAEIYVGGKFHRNTRAPLKLSAGSHTILLKSAGLPDYSRTSEVPKA